MYTPVVLKGNLWRALGWAELTVLISTVSISRWCEICEILIKIEPPIFPPLSSPPGERLFPPPSGLSYSTWFCVERFSTAPHAHPVRLLTVVRRATSSEQHYVCLAVVLSAKDRSLTVSTKEELLQTYCEYSSDIDQPVSFTAQVVVIYLIFSHQMKLK